MHFVSPTKGEMSFDEVMADVVSFIEAGPSDQYKVIIGSDSQNRPVRNTTTFVTAIIVYRVGKGARYYFRRHVQRQIRSLRHRIFTEASLSIEVSGLVAEKLTSASKGLNLEIHMDIGERGETKRLIKDVVGWITSSGYEAKIKPDSFGASSVADRYTKA